MQQAQCSSNSVADFLEERSLRKLTDPAALVTTLLGFGRFTLYTEVKGLSLLCPNGKQVYTFGHFASRWDLTRLHKTTDWTEGAWLKLQSCASMAHLSAPMFLMLLAYITPPSVARVIQEQCMRKRAALVVWREIPKWLVTCGTVLKEVQKEITAPFEDIDPSTALRKWCTTLPKPNQTWGEFLVHEQALCAQLEPAIAWTVRRDKLLKCLTDCFPYFRDNELSRERHLPHLRKSPGILDFLGDLQKIADSHAPLALDDVLGVAVEPAWSRKNKSLKGKGYASGQSNIHQESLTDNKKPKSDTPIDRSEGKLPAPKQGKPAKKSQGCHKCGDLTHWKRDCPLLVTKAEVKSEAATPDAKPDKQTRSGRTYLVNDGGDLTLGSVYVLNSDSNSDGVLLKAGLDTCSTINLVSSSVLPNLRFTVTKLDDALTVDSIGGQTVLKRMAEVRILTKEGVVTANFFVIHAKALPAGLDLLVGKDTLHRLGYRLVNANVEEPAEELQPPVTACDRDEDPTSWVRPPLSAVLKRFTSPTPTAKPVFDDTLEDMVARGRDFMLQELGVWRVVYGNKNYRCRVRPLEDGEQPEKDCKTQTHVFEFDWLDLPADEKHAKASRNPDFSTGLLKRLGDESRKSFEAEIEKYLDRGWWRPQAEHHDVDTEEKITVFPVEQPTHLSHPVRPCADCRRRNLALPRASYHGLSLGECASVLMASSPKYLRFKDISKAFYRLHLPSWRSVGLQTGGRKFSSRRVVFGLRFGPLALENFTIHLVRSVMMALTGVPPPRLVPEELCSHVEGLVLLAYYDDFAIASNDLKLVELVGLLLDRIGAVFGMVFPAEKAAVVTREPSRHLGLDWWYQDGILHAACPILSEEEWKTEVDNVFNKPGRLTKRSLFRLCGLLLDPLGLHPERELILNKIRSWAGSYGSAVDLPSWDRLLPATQQDKEVLLSLFAQVRQLSSPCSHRSWGGGRVLHALSDASEAGFGWTISTEEGALVAEKCRAFPEGLRWHCNRKEMFSVVDLLKKVVRLVELGLKIDTITLSSDNGSTVAWCNDNVTKVKGFDKIALGRLLNQYREAEEILQTRNISLRVLHIKGALNVRADALSRYSSSVILPTSLCLVPEKPKVFLINGQGLREHVEDDDETIPLTPNFKEKCAIAITEDDTKWKGLLLRKLTLPEEKQTQKERTNNKYFFTSDGNLYFRDLELKDRLYIPDESGKPWNEKLRVIFMAHSHRHHYSAGSMVSRLRDQVWWPSLKRDVRAFVAQCFVCRREALRILPLGGRHPHQLGNRFSTLMVDFAGPFRGVTVDGPGGAWENPSILLLIDPFSSWLELVLCKDQTAIAAIDGVISWSLRFGIPEKIHSDRGSSFTSDLSQAVWQAFGVSQSTGAGHHPEAQGAVENAVKFVKSAIRKLVAHVPLKMVLEELQWVARMHNTKPKYQEDITPEMVVYGNRTRDCIDALLETSTSTSSNCSADANFVDELRDTVAVIHRLWSQLLAEKRVGNVIGDTREDPVEENDTVFRVIVDGLHKRRVLGPYLLLSLNTAGSMAKIKRLDEDDSKAKDAPTWQLYKAPSLDITRWYGDLNFPKAQALRPSRPMVGALVGFRTYGTDDVTYIDIGKVTSEDDEEVRVQRYYLDDKGRWHDTNADHERLELLIKKSDICLTGKDVKLDKLGRPTSSLRRLLAAAGVE